MCLAIQKTIKNVKINPKNLTKREKMLKNGNFWQFFRVFEPKIYENM